MQLAAGLTVLGSMVIGTSLAVTDAPEPLRILTVAGLAAAGTAIADVFRWHPPGALFLVFAAGATATLPSTSTAFLGLALAGGGSVAFSLLITSAFALLRRGVRQGIARPVRASASVQPVLYRRVAATSLMVGAGTLLAGFAGSVLIGTHWYWAMVAAVAALGGPHVKARVVRGLQWLVGTLAGIVLATGLLALELPPLATIAAAVLCQVGAELFVSRNYAIAMIFVTQLALLMVDLAVPADAGELLRDRMLETVIGVAAGALIAVLSVLLQRVLRSREVRPA
ncbi:FUSC family protein [Nesterenkonia lacusekhoensis]|uniref:Integral membrane bound transporter domain-containing protein n=1 Tax=Nesterenkonia lacusekhoensis TaxID=150832 RepID=A0ABS4T426_9MICC|nr:FUSC family protein [Nesterenkonia lacusekhoensis]MBP2319218.1 hypothetical protein [Nesterenkonia lacusekhoensis]